MDKKKKIIIGAILVIVVILILFFLWLLFLRTPTYIVTFDSNGGSSVDSQAIKKGQKAYEPEAPTFEGYTFDGWYYEEELFDFNTEITKNITLIAKWVSGDSAGIKLNVEKLTLAPEKTATLRVQATPKSLGKDGLIWSSSDESIVTVDESGNIKAIKVGKAVITVKTKDGKYTATCEITVEEGAVSVESVTIEGATEVYVGSTITLTAKINPENATNKEVTWSSSNNNIATVDEAGHVRGVSAGEVTITVTTTDGEKIATYKITVKAQAQQQAQRPQQQTPQAQQPQAQQPTQPSIPQEPQKPTTQAVTGVTISGASEVYVGESINLTATLSPSNATNKNVTWSSNNNSVATVDGAGHVRGVSAGTVVITVTTSDGAKTASHTVTVKQKESVYEIHLTPIVMGGTGAVTQYNYYVTKDGANFTGYVAFYYGGLYIEPNGGTIDVETVNKGEATVTITLTDGTTKQARVIK